MSAIFVSHLKPKDWKGDIGEYKADCKPNCEHCCHGVESQYNVFTTGAKDLDCNNVEIFFFFRTGQYFDPFFTRNVPVIF